MNVKKIGKNIFYLGYTNSTDMQANAEPKKPAKKGNFRRNKFEYSSSCIENNPPQVQK